MLELLDHAGVAVFAATFDPNRYKGEIERLVKERTGRTLSLKGDLAVAFWPSLGAKVGGVTLSERGSDTQFLALESAHASVALMPLLGGEVVVDGVTVAGLKAQVIRDKNGRFNFQDLLGEEKPKAVPEKKESSGGQAVAFDIAGVTVERSAVSYRDVATGQELALSDFNLDLGRIAEKADGDLKLSAHVKGNQPAVDARVQVASGYQFDLPAQSFALSKLNARVTGAAALLRRIHAGRGVQDHGNVAGSELLLDLALIDIGVSDRSAALDRALREDFDRVDRDRFATEREIARGRFTTDQRDVAGDFAAVTDHRDLHPITGAGAQPRHTILARRIGQRSGLQTCNGIGDGNLSAREGLTVG